MAALKQPIVALATVIAWLWLGWSLCHEFAHGCALVDQAVTRFLQ